MTLPNSYQPVRSQRRPIAPYSAPEAERALSRKLDDAIALVLAENHGVLASVDCAVLECAASSLERAKRVFVAGEGRSGLAVRMVAMRLMHLGCVVHVIGETTTPAMDARDALIAFSGSGKTGVVTLIAERARAVGGVILAVTTDQDSPLAGIATHVITIMAASKHDRSQSRSLQFAGSLFEQSALLLFDALFHVLSDTSDQAREVLWARHTNLE